MKWEGRRESENVEDRRGMGVKAGMALGGGGLIIALIAMFLGVDPNKIAGLIGPPAGQQGPAVKREVDPEEERLAKFSKTIFADCEDVWEELFRKNNIKYQKPTLVLFTDRVESACGLANAAVGPFYCPGDGKVYIDLSFYQDMQKKLNAPGEFARAYVLAHEVGHHVQNLLGYSEKVQQARQTLSKAEANKMSVRLELQADYLAGVWAHHAQKKFNFLEKGDLESAMNAANSIGDDRLQKQAQGYVVPDAFSHGTSKQRMRWFTEGVKTGDLSKLKLFFEIPYDEL